MGATRPALGLLARVPLLDLGPEPQLDSTLTKVEYGSRHVFVAVLVDADGVVVGKAEQFGDAVGVEEIV